MKVIESKRSRGRQGGILGRLAAYLLPAAMVVIFCSFSGAAQAQPGMSCCSDRWDPARTERGRWGPDRMGPAQRPRMARHWAFMHEGVGAEYRGQENPFESSADAVNEGRGLYATHCELCHGSEGLGDGEIANSLSPSPALLAYLVQRPMAVDEFLLWSISEGGQAFESSMPAFKETLSRDEIWKIVTFMRAGFPPVADDNAE